MIIANIRRIFGKITDKILSLLTYPSRKTQIALFIGIVIICVFSLLSQFSSINDATTPIQSFFNADWLSYFELPDFLRSEPVVTNAMTIKDVIKKMRGKIERKLEKVHNISAQEHAKQLSRIRVKKPDGSPCPKNFVTTNITITRLGNLLWQVASLFGVAEKINQPAMILNLDHRFEMFEAFWIPNLAEFGDCTMNTERDQFLVLTEVSAGVHTPKLEDPALANETQPILLKQVLQSWLYFSNVNETIRTLFTFRKSVYDKALQLIEAKLVEYFIDVPEMGIAMTPVMVGVHVRRTDFVNNTDGLEAVPDTYINDRMEECREKWGQVVFLIVSDDLEYCRKTFQGEDIYVLDNHPPEVHMAIVTLMDNVIISAGTFSWWSAYLSEAENVFYYADFPKAGSPLEFHYYRPHYFPPEWLGRLA